MIRENRKKYVFWEKGRRDKLVLGSASLRFDM
jgi:hypothetical protein